MRISLIVARAQNGVIGKDNAIPWRIPADMKYFKRATLGKVVIMGRKTFESLGKPLTDRLNVVLTKEPSVQEKLQTQFSNVMTCPSLDVALTTDYSTRPEVTEDEVMIIGGAQIYAQALANPFVTRIYITEVHGRVDGDTYFPVLDSQDWTEVSRDRLPKDQSASHDCSFVVLERRAAPALN